MPILPAVDDVVRPPVRVSHLRLQAHCLPGEGRLHRDATELRLVDQDVVVRSEIRKLPL